MRLNRTYGFLGFFDAGLDLLQRALELIVEGIDFVLVDDGDGCLGGELLGACPPQAAVPGHSVGRRDRATTMGDTGHNMRIKRKGGSCA